jgi:hypothetical protein
VPDWLPNEDQQQQCTAARQQDNSGRSHLTNSMLLGSSDIEPFCHVQVAAQQHIILGGSF